MSDKSNPPKAYTRFVERFPGLSEAWDRIHEAGEDGPLDARTQRLIKLAVSIGAQREGPVHASVRKALRMGIRREEIEQVIALAASTLGMPATVAAHSWAHDVLDAKET